MVKTGTRFVVRLVAIAIAVASGRATAAVDCGRPRGRIDKEICASPDLRQAAAVFDAAFSDALARAPDQASALRATERTWSGELDKGCIMPNHEALDRCILAQYRIRSQELALLVPEVAPAPSEPALKPGVYLSDNVIFRLRPGGEFEMTDLSRSREAIGHYAVAGEMLTLLDGTGDVGATRFPLKCRVVRTAEGFAVKLGQPQCHQLDGLAFRSAT